MRYGFSLVELSIVLVILGLLVGGVLSGQSLIRAAELRAVSSEYARYVTATQSFRDKYFALPGDMTNAVSFWGAADGSTGNTAACVTAIGTGTQTCNGNGDGILTLSTSSNEIFRFWQQLANAGLIEGSYDGVTHGSTSYAATKANCPTGKLSNSLWFVFNYNAAITGNPNYFNGTYGNHFEFGGITANTGPSGAVLNPSELWNIDTKIDDGKPAQGKVWVYTPSGLSACTTTVANDPTNLAADYLLTSTSKVCSAMMLNQF